MIHTKEFIGEDINVLMFNIKKELGKNAIILEKKEERKPGVKGLFSKKKNIRITAGIETCPINNIKKDNNNEVAEQQQLHQVQQVARQMAQEKQSLEQNSQIKDIFLLQEMQEMKKLINSMSANVDKESNTNINKLNKMLEDLDVNKDTIIYLRSLMGDLSSEDIDMNKKIYETLKDVVEVSNEELSGNVVLVGPTGVGKTTTIAKMAGRLTFIENKKVGLITLDTFRIGAVDQLKIYCEIMNLPFKVVLNSSEMEKAIEEMKDCDVVLIDTTGRSSKNLMQLNELRTYITKAKTDNIQLVVSSTTKDKDIKTIVEGYKQLNFRKVIITKLDETNTYGSILNIINYAKKPISFLTVGQQVPEDIISPTKEKIIKLILGVDNIC